MSPHVSRHRSARLPRPWTRLALALTIAACWGSGPVNAAGARTRVAVSGRAQLSAPRPARPMDGRRFDFEDLSEAVVPVSWEASQKAVAHLFQVAVDDSFVRPLNYTHQVLRGETPVTAIDVVGLPAGGFYWRVAGVDGDGNLGAWSPVQRFSVNAGAPPAGEQSPSPKLEIESSTPIGSRVIIKGIATHGERLEAYMNGVFVEDVFVDFEGTFSVMLDASQEGTNVVRLVAVNKSGQTTVREVEFHYRGY